MPGYTVEVANPTIKAYNAVEAAGKASQFSDRLVRLRNVFRVR